MDTLTLISALRNTTKRNEKKELIERAFLEGNREFFLGARLTYDPLVTFGVKKVALIEGEDDGQGDYDFDRFMGLATLLMERKLTGHAARDAINEAASISPYSYWNDFIRCILIKDLRIGASIKTINDVLEGIGGDALQYITPVFGTQLAKDGADPKNEKKIKGVRLLDLKLDGVRLLTFIDKEERTVVQYSREGLVLDTFPHIRQALLDIIDLFPASMVLDGEVTSTSFQELMEQLQRKKPDASNAKLALFDIIPIPDFRKGKYEVSQAERHEILTSLAGLFSKTNGSVYVLPKLEVDLDSHDGYQEFLEFNRSALEAGYEGIMIKDPNAYYVGDRVDAWLKIKPFIELTLEAKDFLNGKDDGKWANGLGSVLFEGEDEGKKVSVDVGSGFSDKDRKEIWENIEEYRGMLADIRADALSLAKGSDVYSMRFPRFKGWRGRTPFEKL